MTSLLAILALIAINAFFVTAEFSIVSVRRSRIQQLVLEGDTQARTVQSLQRDINRLLSTTQIGITLSCLALGWISEKIVSSVMARLFVPLQNLFFWNASLTRTVAIAIVFFSVAYLQIVLGELAPKTLALRYAERLSRSLGPLSFSISKLLYPFVWLLNHSTEFLLGVFGIQFSDEELFGQMTTKELQLLAEASPAQSPEQEEDRQLLRNFFEFGEVEVKEVMVPRTSVDFFPLEGTYQDFMTLIATTRHDAYPVINQTLDDVRGVVSLRSLSEAIATRKINLESPISGWMTPPTYVNEDTSIQDALHLMMKIDQPILMVREEDVGGTAGLIHLNDILSVIVDSPEDSNPAILPLPDMAFSIQGQTPIDDINEQLGINIPEHEEYQTLAGFVLFELQKVPAENDQFERGQIEYTILSLDGPRIERVQLKSSIPAIPENH